MAGGGTSWLDLALYPIALAMGYEAAAFFGRLFRRKLNLTPAPYRRRFGGLSNALQGWGAARRSDSPVSRSGQGSEGERHHTEKREGDDLHPCHGRALLQSGPFESLGKDRPAGDDPPGGHGETERSDAAPEKRQDPIRHPRDSAAPHRG